MKYFFMALFLLVGFASMAQSVKVEKVRSAGPFSLLRPAIIDSVDASQKKYSDDCLLETSLSFDALASGEVVDVSGLRLGAVDEVVRNVTGSCNLYLAAFSFDVKGYAKVEVKVSGPALAKVYVDRAEVSGSKPYQPGRYQVVVKYVSDTAALKVELSTKDSNNVTICDVASVEKRPFSLADNMQMRHYYGVSVSPSGKYARVNKTWFDPNGSSRYESACVEVATGREVLAEGFYEWMPTSDKYLKIRNNGRRELLAVDPSTGAVAVLCKDLPECGFTMSPTEDFLILSEEVKGPERESGVYEILVPDDRQPGYRNRSKLSKLDLATGLVQPLTYGNKNVWLYDIASDGKSIVFGFSHERLTKRPTTLVTVCRMDLATLQVDTLIKEDGFLSSISLIPGTNNMLVTASPEAFGRIGCTLPASLIPNQFDYQLYFLDGTTKEVKPLTKDFNPSIKSIHLSNNGLCYILAEDKDSVSLFKMDLKSFGIVKVEQPCEVIGNASLSANGTTMLYYGTGACSADKLYALTTKKNQVRMMEDLNAERIAQIDLGTCEGFSFMSKNGYPISGHYYLPAHFDASKKYPVIVHYYGGCSPTARRFGGGSHYPAHYWNANGYIVLVVNPGGASGFGQEWGARHVNTMGEGVAEDIIEATEWFAQNAWVNRDKIGCVSASYGGFMTQLLLTKTDLFATGISHAGISDHTSYWGEGYWGYSYSEVSAADSYPWTRKDLYVDRSPLYNADKIHKPILFTHGTADTNVPIGESIQMYTALKLLGVPTAFIMVEGENHGIMDFNKRQKWINSMVAWFNRWLQDDPSWWNEIYTPKEL
ncbi:MAG: prolyl oligopeptidase family serine peptidase [Bacteroidales bacterium]|nr:prolyl oligopeptidase family serine peptidase [Bacteroidales bacterium]